MFWSVNSYITNDWETAPRSGGLALPANWSLYFLTTIFHLSKSNQYLTFGTLILPFCETLHIINGLLQWLSSKESACKAGATGDAGWIPGSGRSLGGGHGNPLQYSCLENPMDRGAWWVTVHEVAKSQTHLIVWLSSHESVNLSD